MRKSAPHVVAFVTVAIDLLGFGIVLPLLPLYGDKLLVGHVSTAYHGLVIGLLMSSFSAMQFLFAPMWGRLSDRIGRRPVLMLGLASSAAFYALFGYASTLGSLALVFVSRIGAGIAGATIGTAQAVIADSTPPEKRARGMALIGMAFGVGFTLGPLIGTILVSDEPDAPLSAAPGYVAAALSLAALLFAFFRLPETRPEGTPSRRRWFDLEGWRLALGHRPVAVPLLTFFVTTLAFANFEGTVARFARDELHYRMDQMGFLFAYIGVVLVLTQGFIVRRLVVRIGEVWMTVIGLVLMLGGLATVGPSVSGPHVAVVLLAMALAVAGFAFVTPSLQALVSKRSSSLRQGEVLGVNQAAAAIARILGPLIGNILYGPQRGGHPALPLYAGAGLLAIALLLSLGLPERVPIESPTVNE